jgi:dihydroflavonol-4-reductase
LTRVFVTGANGFMGSRIVRELLARGYDVTALTGADLDIRNLKSLDVEVRALELRDPASVREALAGGELLVHSAACYSFWRRDPEHIYRVNVDGTRNVLEAASAHGYRKVVYTSSAATLTPAIDGEAGAEDSLFDLRRFQGDYKSSKVIAEIAVLRAAARGLPAVILHPTAVVGEGDRRPTPSGGMIVHFLNGRMKAYADTVLNIVDVDDVARGHALALERGEPGDRYILGGENLHMRQLLRLLSELTGIPCPKLAIPPRLLLAAARVDEWLARRITKKRAPTIDVEAALHALSSRPLVSTAAEKELGYVPGPVRLALARAAHWFVENGYCAERHARRIRAHGGLDAALSG